MDKVTVGDDRGGTIFDFQPPSLRQTVHVDRIEMLYLALCDARTEIVAHFGEWGPADDMEAERRTHNVAQSTRRETQGLFVRGELSDRRARACRSD